MNVLITGFEPFGESLLNPSEMLVKALPPTYFGKIQIMKAILPVDRQGGPAVLMTALKEHEPDAVLAFGLAAGRARISLERVAVNLMDYRIPDNAGRTVQDQPAVPDGPAAYFTTLPVRSMLNSLLEEGIPAELSLSAGAYLCNQVFYTLLHTLSAWQRKTYAGFIHLPALPQQAAQSQKDLPSMNLETEIRAVEVMLACLMAEAQ